MPMWNRKNRGTISRSGSGHDKLVTARYTRHAAFAVRLSYRWLKWYVATGSYNPGEFKPRPVPVIVVQSTRLSGKINGKYRATLYSFFFFFVRRSHIVDDVEFGSLSKMCRGTYCVLCVSHGHFEISSALFARLGQLRLRWEILR